MMYKFTVKKKLQLLMLLPLLLIVVILSYLNYIYNVIETRDEKNHWLSDVSYLVNQLNMVGYDMVVYPSEDRPKQQWKLISGKISKKLDTHIFSETREKGFIDGLMYKQRKISRLFNRLLYSKGSKLRDTERRNQLAKQVLIQTLAIKNDIHEAININDSYYAQIRKNIILSIALIAFGVIFIIAVIVYYLQNSICSALDVLKKWSADFVSGHLDKKIELNTGDEFKLLADRFFELGWQLKQNHIELDSEIENRKEAEIRSLMLLHHINECQAQTGTGSLDWHVEYGVFYLTAMALEFLGLKEEDETLGFDDFIALIDKSDQQRVLFMLERCRDTGKGFDIDVILNKEKDLIREIHLAGVVSVKAPSRYVNITISMI